ncbi:hypothetical protein VNI00_006756 [Paramarasmius palmivorus]|uniref:Uncharacterized protein n=1 Tax=Paramarasmius palmivorus TaxID=297713 RepID=A0AAW0DAG6_9AGAR
MIEVAKNLVVDRKIYEVMVKAATIIAIVVVSLVGLVLVALLYRYRRAPPDARDSESLLPPSSPVPSPTPSYAMYRVPNTSSESVGDRELLLMPPPPAYETPTHSLPTLKYN